MQTVIPHYLESAAIESGDTKEEIMLCRVRALEAQTAVLERIAVVLERLGEADGVSWVGGSS